MYGDDEKLIDKIKKSGFEGGLKWDSQRLMYIYNLKKKEDGIQLFSMSYPQYKELEDAKLEIWKRVTENGEKVGCPISSPADAFPVQIKRKTENRKTKYTISVDILSGKQPLTNE